MKGRILKQFGTVRNCGGLITRLAYAKGRTAGVDIDRLLTRVGLTAKEINNEEARLSVKKQIEFVDLVANEIGDTNYGFHLAQEFDLRKLGFLYYIGASADILGDALKRLERYSSIANEGIVLKIKRTTSVVRVSLHYSGVPRHTDKHQIEFWIAALIRKCRHLTDNEIRPLQVRLVHLRKDPQNEFKRFIGAEVREHSTVDTVDLRPTAWNLPVVNGDPYLHRCLVRFCEEALTRRGQLLASSVTVKVENAISELLPHGQAHLEKVAAKLGMSPRTLSRQLTIEHSSFTRVLDNMRLALARRYLAERDLRISQVAWLLGYKEIGAFSHAFRRWTGESPRSTRQRQLHS
jgi:AraC-like DNA-binding protein